jgi:hypothetical protein
LKCHKDLTMFIKNIILVFISVLFQGSICFGQHLIGVEKGLFTGLLKKEMKYFNLDKSSGNQNYNYLKYLNSAGTKTLIVFFDNKDISTGIRLVCDYSDLESTLLDFQKKYRRISENSWVYSVNEEDYLVSLESKEWYFVVSIKKK